jgi:hypothetical protein
MVKFPFMTDLRKLGVAVFALGFVLVGLPIAASRLNAQPTAQSSEPWNLHAMEASLAGVRVHEVDGSNAALVFLYDIENKTANDYELTKGPSVVILSRLKSSGSLSSERPVALSSSAFVPARNRTRIELEVRHPFAWPSRMDAKAEDRIRDLVAGEIADLDGFVLFDESTRYQIALPGAWPAVQKSVSAPDHR